MTAASNSFDETDSEALRAARIIENVVGNAWATDAAGKFTYVTPAALSLLGMTLEELNSPSEEGRSGWKRIIHPDDYDGAVATWRRCLQSGEHYNVEHRILRPSGAYGWGRSSGQPLRDSQGRIHAWYGAVIDGDVPSVVSKRFADVANAALEEKAAPDVPHSLRGIHPDDRAAAAHAAARAFWTGVPQVTRHRQLQADGNYRWSETRSEPGYSVSVDIDDLVTDREPRPTTTGSDPSGENEAEAIRSARVVESIFGNGWAFDAAGRWIYLHPFAQNSLGVTLEDLNASLKEGHTGWKRLLHPDDYDQIAAAWRHCLETGDHFNVEFRFRRATGIYVWARTAARPVRDSQSRITGWFGIALDIDVYKKTVAALRYRERELSQLVDMVPSHIWRLAPDGEPIFFNKRMVDFLGLNVTDADKPGMSRLEVVIETIHPDDAAAFRNALHHCLATGEPFSMRHRLRRADGVYHWMSSRADPIRDQDGRIVQWYGLCLDIDDEVRAQEALRDRERELSQLVNMVPVQIRRLTPDGEPTFFNKRLLDFFGLDDVAALDKPGMSRLAAVIGTLVHPDDAANLLETARHSFATGAPFSLKYRMRRADGAYRWVDGRGEPLRDQSEAIVQWYVVSIDIDDEMRAQDALRNRERELSQLVDMVPSLLWRLSPEGEPTFFNKRLVNFLGMNIADTDKQGMSRLTALIKAAVHPDDADSLREALNHSLVTGERFSKKYRLRRADGVYRWVEGSAEPLRDESARIVQWYGLSHDVDDQLRVEEALRRSERQLQQLIDTVPMQIWCVTPGGEPAYINKTMVDYIGLKLEDFDAPGLPSAIETIVHPEDRAVLLGALTHSFSTGEPFGLKFRNRRWDGAYRWTEGRADPLRDESGRTIRWYGANVDIHDFVISQEALRERERSLWQLVETLPVMIDCAAPDGEPIYRSQQLREFLGYELEELDDAGKSRLAGTLDAGVHPDDVAGVKEQYAHSLSTGEPYSRKHRLRRFDGEYLWVDTRAAPMRNAEGAIVQWNVICLDIDGEVRAQEELRLAQERLARASQAASLAELSASIAHEVNQPLAAIVANSHACYRWLAADPPNLERAKITAERIIRDANSAADVVSRIRALFRPSLEMRTSMPIPSVIAEARDLMAEEAMRRRVRMDVDIESNLPLVAFDRVQIQQVLVNLVRNGVEAMDAIAGDKVLGIRARRIEDKIQIDVSDRGPGVEHPDKIFESFFTTKGNGMGMGLAISRSIVESHGGRLWAENSVPRGATFIFTLPVEAKAAQ
ncbi:PAS domain-containing protein [Mesorhizobium sp. ISC25]|uniref:PAS domain-containing protein n=1 Tax=Mesorhizobium sp. ISC25 TaxID=3077335 RepID=UPI0035E39F6D